VSGREVGGFPSVEEDGSRVPEAEDLVDVERRRRISVEQRTNFAIALHLELEVVRFDRLSFGDHRHELVLARRSERVVGTSLLADR
jgi:hypothetical protein